jgi:hypothetical protein
MSTTPTTFTTFTLPNMSLPAMSLAPWINEHFRYNVSVCHKALMAQCRGTGKVQDTPLSTLRRGEEIKVHMVQNVDRSTASSAPKCWYCCPYLSKKSSTNMKFSCSTDMNMGPPSGWYKMLAVNLKIFKYPTWLGSRRTEVGVVTGVERVGRGTSRSAVFMDLISLPRKINNKSEWLNSGSSNQHQQQQQQQQQQDKQKQGKSLAHHG